MLEAKAASLLLGLVRNHTFIRADALITYEYRPAAGEGLRWVPRLDAPAVLASRGRL